MAQGGSKTKRRAAQPKGGRAGADNLRANRAQRVERDAAEPLVDGGAAADIAGVVLAVVAVASFIAVVTPSSAPLTHAVSQLYHLGFGLGAYLIPLVMLAAAVLLFLRGAFRVPARILGGVALIFVAVESVLSLHAPNTELSTVGMFEPAALSSCGGYLGAFFASVLQNALGKTISMVVLVGFVALGLVIIGFSVGDMARAVASGAEQLVRRRRIDVNAPRGAMRPPGRPCRARTHASVGDSRTCSTTRGPWRRHISATGPQPSWDAIARMPKRTRSST